MERGKARRTRITNRNSLRPQEWSMSSCLNPSCADSYFQLMTDTETEKHGHTPTKGQLHAKIRSYIFEQIAEKSLPIYISHLSILPTTFSFHQQSSDPCKIPSHDHFQAHAHQLSSATFHTLSHSDWRVTYWFVVTFWYSFLTMLLASKRNLGKLKRKKSKLNQDTSRAWVGYLNLIFTVNQTTSG